MSTLTFVRQGSILSGGRGLDGQISSLKGRIAKMSVFWVIGCVLYCKTGFEAFL